MWLFNRNKVVLQVTVALLCVSLLAACDCTQEASGVVLDSQTRKPLRKVSLSKLAEGDTARRLGTVVYSDDSGHFNFHAVSGGFRHCPKLVLYGNKPGYQQATFVLASSSLNDTLLLTKLPFHRDSSIRIHQQAFDEQVAECIHWMDRSTLKDLSDDQHIQVMYCLNTIFMRSLEGGLCEQLVKASEKAGYTTRIIELYPEWVPNRGGGFYFPALQMELYGTPTPNAVYNLVN